MLNDSNENNEQRIALSTQQDDAVIPELIGLGKGLLAHVIIQLAEKHNIEFYENQDISEIFAASTTNSAIPIEAYNAVTEIIAYILRNSR